MVGRPGISKACFQCKQRRKGCDLQRPACSQCIRLGLKCPGYTNGLVFVYEKRLSDNSNKTRTPQCGSGLQSTQSAASLIKLGTQTGLDGHFWHLYLPRSYLCPSSQDGALNDIFDAVQESCHRDRASEYAFRSLCCLTVARAWDDPDMFRQGSIFYGMSIRELHSAIEDARHRSLTSHPSMTLTCNLLVLYEVGMRNYWKHSGTDESHFQQHCGPSHQGFFTHGQGLAQIVEIQGPSAFCDDLAWLAFQGVRMAVVLTSLLQRKSSFLASKNWCMIPWQIRPKHAWQRVVDVLAHVPELMEVVDKLPGNTYHAPEQDHTSGLFFKVCHKLDQSLHTCYQELPSLLGLEPNTPLWLVKRTSLSDFPFPTEVFFADQAHAHALILFWATIVHAYHVLQSMDSGVKWAIMETLKPLGFRYLRPGNPDIISIATRIAQSTPYFLQPDGGLLMHKIFTYPLGVAQSYFSLLDQKVIAEESGATVADIQQYLERTARTMYLKAFQLRNHKRA